MTTAERSIAELAEWLDSEIRRAEGNHAATLTRGQQIELSVLRSVRSKITEAAKPFTTADAKDAGYSPEYGGQW